MPGWLWLLIWAALFYFMMRYGCGAHMVHGGHSGGEHEGHGEHQPGIGSVKDPVCGMVVDPGQGYSEIHEGKQYRFCSKKCLDKFDAEPHRYVS